MQKFFKIFLEPSKGSLRHLSQLEIFLVIKRMLSIRFIRYSQQKPSNKDSNL
jgi:hypothetical protein